MENLSREINSKGKKNDFCKNVYSCPKYYRLKLETAIPERLTNLH